MRPSRQNDCVGWAVGGVFLVGILLICWGVVLSGCAKREPQAVATRPAFVAEVNCYGTSMLPAFQDGERIRVEFCRYDDLKGGQTVIRWDGEVKLFVHHRALYRNETGRWVTRGDNNASVDRGVMTPEEFVGRTHKL